MGIDRALARDRETVPGSQPAPTVPLIDLHYLVRTELERDSAGRAGRGPYALGQAEMYIQAYKGLRQLACKSQTNHTNAHPDQ